MARQPNRPALPYWSRFDWGKYSKHTAHLDGELHAALLNVLRVYLSSTGPLPNDEAEIFLRASVKTKALKRDTRTILRLCFWLGEDGRLHNDFADELIAIGTSASKAHSAVAKAAAKGRERNERGHFVVKAGGNQPANAGASPANAGNERPANAGSHPQIKSKSKNKSEIEISEEEVDPRGEIGMNTSTFAITPPEVHLERNSVDVPRNTPAPDGADMEKSSNDCFSGPVHTQLPLAQIPPKANPFPAGNNPSPVGKLQRQPDRLSPAEADAMYQRCQVDPAFSRLPREDQLAKVRLDAWRKGNASQPLSGCAPAFRRTSSLLERCGLPEDAPT